MCRRKWGWGEIVTDLLDNWFRESLTHDGAEVGWWVGG